MTPNPKQPNDKLRPVVCNHHFNVGCDPKNPKEPRRRWCPDCGLAYVSFGCIDLAKQHHLAECQSLLKNLVDPPVDWEPTMPRGEKEATISSPGDLVANISVPFTRLSMGTWFLGRSRDEVNRILVDSYRLRMSDMSAAANDADLRDMYHKFRNCPAGFYHFTVMAVQQDGIIPKWWGERNLGRCLHQLEDLRSGQDSGVSDHIDQDVVIDRYGKDMSFPVLLRLLAAKAYGWKMSYSPGEEELRRLVYREYCDNKASFSAS
ncbi:hypothetical protein EDB81DRAFT_762530 [Dactylonectria macrodidyma]|uniref:Uncharacterized protein n=1 Tax=Dactylonectria macrodidyma TaxID=307937 RepID=A0A9P9IUQ8_9HYPO|nr:hypothetical protein EDB81DRAFT_762530 [Dactylonectria macrodidyma]